MEVAKQHRSKLKISKSKVRGLEGLEISHKIEQETQMYYGCLLICGLDEVESLYAMLGKYIKKERKKA